MSKIHFVTNSGNERKVAAIKNVLQALPLTNFYFNTAVCEKTEHRPLSIKEIEDALEERIDIMKNTYKCPLADSIVHIIDIQKGTNIKDVDQPLKLFCMSRVVAVDQSKISTAMIGVSMPEKIRELVLGGMPLYNAYGKVFGEKIKNKEVSLYEHLTGKSELSWFEEVVFKTFLF